MEESRKEHDGMKKTVFVLASMLFSIFAIPSFAGELVQDDMGFRYLNDDGSFKTGWHQEGQGGPWYFFGEDGYHVRGWMYDKEKRYYFRQNGQMVAGCFTDFRVPYSRIYQFDEKGVCIKSGEFYNGWLSDDGGWYYRQFDGSYATGWKKIGDKWYYFDADGYMMTGTIQVDGVAYYLDGSGAWVEDGGNGAGSQPNEPVAPGSQSAAPGSQAAASGAEAAAWPYKAVTYVPPEAEKSDFHKSVDAMADSILAGIVNDSMSQRQKAEAIYAWIRRNFRYSGHSATRDWVEEAYQGIRKRHGDCYTYFAVSQELLSRCNIPSIEVVRSTDNDHFWNLVQLEDGAWYHFDATPRSSGGYFCLWSDKQMLAYSAAHRNCFAFERALYPPTP